MIYAPSIWDDKVEDNRFFQGLALFNAIYEELLIKRSKTNLIAFMRYCRMKGL